LGSIKRAAVFVGSTIAALVVMDIYLQLAEIQTPMETRVDPALGPTYIPGKPIARFNEGFFIGSVNEFGYMGPAIPPRRRAGERRILLLGDSFVLGHTVLPRHYFGRYLEGALSAATGAEVHALNFGKADFDLGNMFQYYEDFAEQFDHDAALFFLREDDLLARVGQRVASDLYPTVRLEGEKIVVDKSFQFRRTFRFYKAIEPLFTRSAVLRLAFNAYKVLDGGGMRLVVFDKFAAIFGSGREAPPPPSASAREELPALSKAILREISKDPRNLLVIQTPLRPEIAREIQATGIPVIDLGSYLEQLHAEGQDPYYWPVTKMRGHWNHAAQAQIGRFLADRLASRFDGKGEPISPAPGRSGPAASGSPR
jgi:hypothetical protein